jgi:hypothetical protein
MLNTVPWKYGNFSDITLDWVTHPIVSGVE